MLRKEGLGSSVPRPLLFVSGVFFCFVLFCFVCCFFHFLDIRLMSESFYLGKKIVTENKSQWLKRNESFKHPKFFNGSSWIITVQASSNPTKMLEGRVHRPARIVRPSGQQGWWSPSSQMKAPQASKGDQTHGCLFPHSVFTCVVTISIINSCNNNPGQAQQRQWGALSIWSDRKKRVEWLLSGHI